MKKIDKYTFDSYATGITNPIIAECLKLEVNEGLQIDFDDWKGNYSPMTFVYSAGSKHGKKFSFKTNKKDRYWLVLRVL